MHPDICKIRIPRNIDRPTEKRFNLGFVESWQCATPTSKLRRFLLGNAVQSAALRATPPLRGGQERTPASIREQHVVTWNPARSEKIIDHFRSSRPSGVARSASPIGRSLNKSW